MKAGGLAHDGLYGPGAWDPGQMPPQRHDVSAYSFNMDLATSLRLLDQKMRDQTPSNEGAIQDLLAQAIREAEDLEPSEVEIEAASGRKRIDIVVRPFAAGIEIKYHRPIPSGHNRPMTNTERYSPTFGS